MADEEKPFICYKNGWNLKIVPRNVAGWSFLAVWLLTLAPPTAGYVWLMARGPSDAAITAWTTGFVILSVSWAGAMIRWAYLRSEIVDLKELLQIKRERDRANRRGRS